MATPYSNGYTPSSGPRRGPGNRHSDFDPNASDDDLGALVLNVLRLLWNYSVRRIFGAAVSIGSVLLTGTRASTLLRDSRRRRPRPQPLAIIAAETLLRLVRHSLAPQRIFSVPHFLVAFWVLVLLWGERGNFHAKVMHCHWDHWEKWPAGAEPHHMVFVADPQLIDAHTYPGRPWPLSSLTVMLTDNYMRRSYRELQEQLQPDTVFFLGDLFDGGREWRPAHGSFQDPSWSSRPDREKGYAKMWRKKYDEDYWLKEYARFGDIFLDPWTLGGTDPGPGQRGRRVIASLPGNHDLGFGSEVQLSVRNRFQSYFGEGNRVDVIGNHTFVSVDTVSLSADTSDRAGQSDVQSIYKPVEEFLSSVAWEKTRAVSRELRFQRGTGEEVSYPHRVEDLNAAEFDTAALAKAQGAGDALQADLPTVLLTHVPLYRPPGTPCGPHREHWPATKPPADDPNTPVFPDHRNAIPVSRGYQYQNVLSESDSVKLIRSIGNVKHAFSGDDHDYCEVVHDDAQEKVKEITVKSFSMAMGVPTPGFLMLSLYNPVDAKGNPLATVGAPPGEVAPPTMQTHLCLLPNQLSTFARYGGMAVVSIVLLAIYAVLIQVLHLPVFAFDPLAQDANSTSSNMPSSVLPMFSKAKVEDDEYGRSRGGGAGAAAAAGGSGYGTDAVSTNSQKGASDSSSFVSFRAVPATYSRGRSYSNQYPNQQQGQPASHGRHQKGRRNGHAAKTSSPANNYDMRGGPKIQIARDTDDSSSDDSAYNNDLLSDDYMVDVNLGGGSSRWQPAARRGVFGLSMAAVSGVRRFVVGTLGLRSGGGLGGGRRRRGGGGVGGGLSSLLGLGGGVLGRSGSGASSGSAAAARRRRSGRSSQQRLLQLAGWEFYAMAFRVAWMVVAYWAWLNHKG
ncbi:manganese ion homeostasis protein [Sporothrix brasiliensis 5110]|uniref:Manganese ion homeostasis protein n=1 Tax=Sporothrix brasiliensis 5110 TaxID=1398154 RepID=A0A0C2IGU5_9PEZI|nr:manganese ion homeostasis protein [Sporothrix brasiliensis 5110]KIH88436.1 manganese ion homeostasis protein [Sporothrix brasiliensis 5110]